MNGEEDSLVADIITSDINRLVENLNIVIKTHNILVDENQQLKDEVKALESQLDFIDEQNRYIDKLEKIIKEKQFTLEEIREYVISHTRDYSEKEDGTYLVFDLVFEKANGYDLLQMIDKHKEE